MASAGFLPKHASSFPGPVTYLQQVDFGFDADEVREILARIDRTARDGLGFTYLEDDAAKAYTMHELGDDLWALFTTYRRDALHLVLGGRRGWEDAWRRAVTYGYWSLVLQMNARLASIQHNAATGDENWGAPALEWFGGIAGDCLALGWNDYARDLARRSRWMKKMRGFPDGGPGFHRVTQRFVLRLAAGTDTTSSRGLGVPAFDAVLKHWRTASAAHLAPLLLAMAERHTQQCQWTETEMEFDLPFSAFWYDPFEILAVLRLRASAGLDNPVLDHPLMKTPLGRLPPIVAPVLDPVLAAVATRVRGAAHPR